MTTTQSLVALLIEDPQARSAVMSSDSVPDVVKYKLQSMIDRQSYGQGTAFIRTKVGNLNMDKYSMYKWAAFGAELEKIAKLGPGWERLIESFNQSILKSKYMKELASAPTSGAQAEKAMMAAYKDEAKLQELKRRFLGIYGKNM